MIAPADLESVTVQVLLLPTVIAAGLQASEVIVGVDHRVRVAVCDEVPSVAVIIPDASAVMVPLVAVNAAVLLPAETITPPGTVTRPELEPSFPSYRELLQRNTCPSSSCGKIFGMTSPLKASNLSFSSSFSSRERINIK